MAANKPAAKIVGIVGAAIAGPTLGLQLLSHPVLASRFKTIIFDKFPAPPNLSPFKISSPSYEREDRSTLPSGGAAVALFSNGLFPLYNLDLRDSLDAASAELSALTIWRSGYGSNSPDGSIRPGKYSKLNSCSNPTWNGELQTNARAIEREALQRLLVTEYLRRGGEVRWGKKAVSFSRQESGQMQVLFSDGSEAVVDLLVGADGGFSAVRKCILNERDASTAEARWLPDFMGMTGFYGISTPEQVLAQSQADAETKESTHAFWLDNGNLSVAPLPGGKMRWDLIISEKNPPDPAGPVEPSVAAGSGSAPWETALMPGMYPRSSSVEILKKHAGIYHPVVGNFGALLESAERIIRTPLRQRVWKKEEIQCGNVVLIGDASRLMLPSSGMGTGFGVEDATVLANALLNHDSFEGSKSGIRAALEEFATMRVPRSKNMAYLASTAGSLGLGEQWYSRFLRDFGSKIMGGRDMKKSNGKEGWPFDGRVKVELSAK
ncbi:hypothetical protein C8R47DRAFT_1107639 [Mycena vitilis]|nr:hypothetical protein C8R47DRAFT_1107639 [Mycena vitilis]